MHSTQLSAWGRGVPTRSTVWAAADAAAALAGAGPRGLIARGEGRSYGDACLNDEGSVLQTTGTGELLAFDRDCGVLECTSGVTFRQLLERLLPEGWLAPVTPGTSFVTMGGALANDVHGKNQGGAGSFGDHVAWFDLRLPDGTLQRVTRDADMALFAATVGGIGLTGIIERLQVRLVRVPSNAMALTETRMPDLDAFLERMSDAVATHSHVVGWIDGMIGGRHLGRGILECATPSEQDIAIARGHGFTMPVDLPGWVLSRPTIAAFNEIYYRRVPAGGRHRRIAMEQFLYALDAIREWNRLYGRQGVDQFQCVVPLAESRTALRMILETTVRRGGASFLAVLKRFGRLGSGMLSFPMPGFSLALDFPRRRADTRDLVERLGDIALAHGGRVYLAKDSRLTPAQFSAMYPRLAEFRAVLDRIDPERRMQSDMARRLQVRGAGA